MKVTEGLVKDHRVIERVIKALSIAIEKLGKGERISADFFWQAVDFIRTFADCCHHGKEEDLLFPALEKAGIPRYGGPIGVMLAEHEEGRGYGRGMVQALEKYAQGDDSAIPELIKNARGYVSLLPNHILKEDNILFPMGENVLSLDKKKELLEGFEKVEEERVAGRHHFYVELAEKIEKEMSS